jgi:hypothetical protein
VGLVVFASFSSFLLYQGIMNVFDEYVIYSHLSMNQISQFG